jgi:hypothetical protein
MLHGWIDGAMEGAVVGRRVGILVGAVVGLDEGRPLGTRVGPVLGLRDGILVGPDVWLAAGAASARRSQSTRMVHGGRREGLTTRVGYGSGGSPSPKQWRVRQEIVLLALSL